MGSRPPQRRDDPAEVSLLWLLGTRFAPDPASKSTEDAAGGDTAATLETVGQTGIDRKRGAASATSLRYSLYEVSGESPVTFIDLSPR